MSTEDDRTPGDDQGEAPGSRNQVAPPANRQQRQAPRDRQLLGGRDRGYLSPDEVRTLEGGPEVER